MLFISLSRTACMPNTLSAPQTLTKHVLCEKPMATTVKDSQAMIDACKAANKKLMIAYRCQYEPTNLRAVQLIRDGKLGTIQAIESANGFTEHAGEWRLNRKLAGGGPLMDVGIYSLNACRYLTREEPAHIEGYASVIDHDGRFKEVEENVSWTMKFPSGVVASCNTTYGAEMPGFFRVHGSKGMIHMEPAFAYQGLHLKAKSKASLPSTNRITRRILINSCSRPTTSPNASCKTKNRKRMAKKACATCSGWPRSINLRASNQR